MGLFSCDYLDDRGSIFVPPIQKNGSPKWEVNSKISSKNKYIGLYQKGLIIKNNYELFYDKLKNESIPGIFNNLNEMKNKIEVLDEDKKKINELYSDLKDLEINTTEIEQRLDDTLNNFFENFNCLFNILNDIKETYSNNSICLSV